MGVVHAYGMGFEAAVTDVTGRTSWMREYLEDFKFQAHRPGSRVDRKTFSGGDGVNAHLHDVGFTHHTLPVAAHLAVRARRLHDVPPTTALRAPTTTHGKITGGWMTRGPKATGRTRGPPLAYALISRR